MGRLESQIAGLKREVKRLTGERDAARAGWKEAVEWLQRKGAEMPYWRKTEPWLFEYEEDEDGGITD